MAIVQYGHTFLYASDQTTILYTKTAVAQTQMQHTSESYYFGWCSADTNPLVSHVTWKESRSMTTANPTRCIRFLPITIGQVTCSNLILIPYHLQPNDLSFFLALKISWHDWFHFFFYRKGFELWLWLHHIVDVVDI